MQGSQRRPDVLFRLKLRRKYGLNDALFINDERGAPGDEAKRSPNAVLRAHLAAKVRQKRERKLVFAGKKLMRGSGIRTDAKYGGVVIRKIGECVAKGACLFGAAGRIVLWIEEQHYGLLAVERA